MNRNFGFNWIIVQWFGRYIRGFSRTGRTQTFKFERTILEFRTNLYSLVITLTNPVHFKSGSHIYIQNESPFSMGTFIISALFRSVPMMHTVVQNYTLLENSNNHWRSRKGKLISVSNYVASSDFRSITTLDNECNWYVHDAACESSSDSGNMHTLWTYPNVDKDIFNFIKMHFKLS